MKFIISKEIFEKFPEVSVGVVVARDIDNKSKHPKIMTMLDEIQQKVAHDFDGKSISEDPTIKAWRKVYKDFGAQKYRSSIESMVRRTTKGDWVASISNVVDIYNYISLKYALPLGGEDLDKVEGDIALAEADGTERFIPLFSSEVEHPKSGEIIYKDDKDVMCRRWNWREADKTKLTRETQHAFFVTEGTLAEEKERVELATQELAELIGRFCGGKTETFILDRKDSDITLD